MAQDRDIRRYAVPVRGTIWGMNYNDHTERDIGWRPFEQRNNSDYNDFFPGVEFNGTPIAAQRGASKLCPLRILKPHYGTFVECYADIQITVASGDSDLTLKLGIGKFATNSYDRTFNYTDEEIDAAWRKIHGSDTPLTVSGGVISADLLNLLRAIPVYGDDNYRDEAFVLLLAFNKTPTLSGSFKFNYLNIHTSITGVI